MAAQRLKRCAWKGAFLRSLGHASWAAEQTPSGIDFLGGRHQAPFSKWAGPARRTSTLGFATIAVPLADGRVASLAGVATQDAASFISSATAAFRSHILGQFEAVKDELTALSEAIARLDQPRRYPAACLLVPFLARATAVIGSLPVTMPEGVLSEFLRRSADLPGFEVAGANTGLIDLSPVKPKIHLSWEGCRCLCFSFVGAKSRPPASCRGALLGS